MSVGVLQLVGVEAVQHVGTGTVCAATGVGVGSGNGVDMNSELLGRLRLACEPLLAQPASTKGRSRIHVRSTSALAGVRWKGRRVVARRTALGVESETRVIYTSTRMEWMMMSRPRNATRSHGSLHDAEIG
jgi:hypothetical protein